MAFYIFAVLLSAYHSDFPTATYFSVWQLIRMLTLSVVLARACANEHVPPALMAGLAIGICLEVVLTLTQHGEGVTQAMGQFAHQNLLGLIANSVVMIFLGVYIAKPTAWKLAIVPFAGMIMAVLTASRATLGLYLMGVILLFLLSMIRQYTNQKFWIALVCTMLLAISTPFALSTLAARFAAQPLDEGYDERAAFQAAATLMINDHPLGVGANNYVLVVNLKGYNDRAMVAPVVGSRSANVHNVYYLVTAEIGWFGLFAFVIMLLHPLIVAFRCGWRNRHDLRGDMLIGLGVSMFVTYCHSWFEWIFVAHEAQYFFAIICGLTAGMAMQLDYFAPVRKAVPRLSDGTRTISDATVTI